MTDRDTDTLPTMETLVELIKGFHQDMTARFDRLETKVDNLENGLEGVRVQVLGLDVRQDRLISQMYDTRADIKVLTAEVRAWAKDVIGMKHELERL